MTAREVPVMLVNGRLRAAEHGPWCITGDSRTIVPPPKCAACSPLECCHCGSTDLIGPYAMDGYQRGEYRTDWQWTVCRTCHRSESRGRSE